MKLAILIDPEKVSDKTGRLIDLMSVNPPDFVLVGGSTGSAMDTLITQLKERVDAPVVLFPGNVSQVTEKADVLMFLSLISGRNPEYLIGSHVKAASLLKNTKLKVVPVGYILVDGGKRSAVQRVSGTEPISSTNVELIADTALAGQLLGMRYIYLEAGSGAPHRVPDAVVSAVKSSINIPLIVGGGLKSSEDLTAVSAAGADIAVVGNALESNPEAYINLLNYRPV